VVDFVIPGNDDALRAIRLFASKVSDAVIEGHQMASEPQFAAQPAGAAAAAEGAALTGVGESARYSSGVAYEETGAGVESGSDSFGEDFVGYAEPSEGAEPVPSVGAEPVETE
jgi:small subunit ribosomal protein S2